VDLTLSLSYIELILSIAALLPLALATKTARKSSSSLISSSCPLHRKPSRSIDRTRLTQKFPWHPVSIGFTYTCKDTNHCNQDQVKAWLDQACTGISGSRIVGTASLYKNTGYEGVCACAGDWVVEHTYTITQDYPPGTVTLTFDDAGQVDC
jgi:hypothetical protein